MSDRINDFLDKICASVFAADAFQNVLCNQ